MHGGRTQPHSHNATRGRLVGVAPLVAAIIVLVILVAKSPGSEEGGGIHHARAGATQNAQRTIDQEESRYNTSVDLRRGANAFSANALHRLIQRPSKIMYLDLKKFRQASAATDRQNLDDLCQLQPRVPDEAPYLHVLPHDGTASSEAMGTGAPTGASPSLALLVIPGGAYRAVALKREGMQGGKTLGPLLNASVFILQYNAPPSKSNQPSDEGNVAQKAIVQCWSHLGLAGTSPSLGIVGFSAGGHLAATLGAYYPHPAVEFLVLCYPVISMQANVTHPASRSNLLGTNPSDELVDKYSIELHPEQFPRLVYIWHTEEDEKVPFSNAELMYDALLQYRRDGTIGDDADGQLPTTSPPGGDLTQQAGAKKKGDPDAASTIYLQRYKRGAHASWTRGKGDAYGRWQTDLAYWLNSRR